jgi:PAN domain-containing protein
MAPNSLIGFHAAYFMKGGRRRTSRAANSVIEDYLRELGLSERAIDYVTHSPPERLNWLTVAAARQLGIEAGIYERGKVESTLDRISTGSVPTIKRLASFDLLGYDLPGMPIADSTVTDCEMRCERSADCGAFTFNRENSACFLKSQTDLAVGNPAAISGYRELPDSHVRRIDMVVQQATDFPGNDIGQQADTTFEACLISCSESTACKAFTYVIHRRECWLKDGIGLAEAREGLVSAVK